MAQAACPQGCALIVRTATEGMTMQALEEEAQQLRARWDAAVRKSLGLVRRVCWSKKSRLRCGLRAIWQAAGLPAS